MEKSEDTLPKFNMELKNKGFQKEALIPCIPIGATFRFHAKLWEGNR